MKITVHGFQDWYPSESQWHDMLNTAQIGANQECDVTVDGVRKTIKEWQEDNETKIIIIPTRLRRIQTKLMG